MTREEYIREVDLWCSVVLPGAGNRVTVDRPPAMGDTVTWRFCLDGLELGALTVGPVSGALPSERDDYEQHWRISERSRQLAPGDGGELLAAIEGRLEDHIQAVMTGSPLRVTPWQHVYGRETGESKQKGGAPRLEDREDWPAKVITVERIADLIKKGTKPVQACERHGIELRTYKEWKRRIEKQG